MPGSPTAAPTPRTPPPLPPRSPAPTASAAPPTTATVTPAPPREVPTTTPAPRPAPALAPRPPAPAATLSAAPAPLASASATPLLSPQPVASAEPAPPPPSATASVPPPATASAPLVVVPPPSALPSAAPAASAVAPPRESHVTLGDDRVFSLRLARGGKTAEQRAQAASQRLSTEAPQVKDGDVRFERRGELIVVIVGSTPIVELDLADAQAAGDGSLEVHAARVTALTRDAIHKAHQQAAAAKVVTSISLLVFLGLIAFYLMQKIGEFAERARVWIDAHAESLPVRIRQIEVVSPGTVRSTAVVVLSVGRWLAQLGVFYAWLVVVLSLFEATRGYTEKLTGLILTPLSQLMTRLATGLPVLAVLVIAGFAVFVLVRFLGLFFDSIERRENVVSWLSPDLAAPTSALLRFGVVLSALVFLGPLVTGSSEGVLGRTGAIALVALGLASTPVLASGMLGAIVLFGRRLRPGQHVQIGDHAGRIAAIGLLDLRLEDAERAEVRIPHLYTLRHPTRVLGLRPRFGVDVPVAPGGVHADVQGLLLGVASRFGDDARVELVSADADRTLFRVTFASEQRNARSELQLAIVEALAGAQVPLGRFGREATS
jgi:small-conductance mechanosensitive channel